MIRQAVRGLVAVAAVTLFLEISAAQQPTTPDKIYVRDKKDGTVKTYDGTLQYGAAGFQIVSEAKKTVAQVTPADVVKVVPGETPGLDRTAMFSLITAEEKKTKAEYEKARLGYVDLQKKTGTDVRAKRYVEYKLALTLTRIADETGDDENWAAIAGDAGKSWSAFLADYKDGWEVWAATRALTRLNAETGKFDEAARVWQATGKTAGLSPDLKMEAALQEIDARIRTKGGAAAAQVAAEALGKTVAAGPAKDKLAIYEEAAKAISGDPASGVKPIEDRIAATKDAGVRGVAYSMIGELYLAANKPREAMWAFLWVETVYNADRDEAFKAMCRLVEVFKAQNDEDRAKQYREKIRRARGNF